MEQIYPARDFSKKDEFKCESCEETYGEAYVIASNKEEARKMVKAGEVLCSTCTVEAIIRSYVLEKRKRLLN